MLRHIVAFIAETGVRSDPIFEPIIVAKIASTKKDEFKFLIMLVKRRLIAILFSKLEKITDKKPEVSTVFLLLNIAEKSRVIPAVSNPRTIRNIESKNGIRCHGILLRVFRIFFKDCFFAKKQIVPETNINKNDVNETIHIGNFVNCEMINKKVHNDIPITPITRAGRFRILTFIGANDRGCFKRFLKIKYKIDSDIAEAKTVGTVIIPK